MEEILYHLRGRSLPVINGIMGPLYMALMGYNPTFVGVITPDPGPILWDAQNLELKIEIRGMNWFL